MRDSEFFGDKQLFPGYRSVGLSRNSAYSRIIMGQEESKLSENSPGSWANACIIEEIQLFSRVCLM